VRPDWPSARVPTLIVPTKVTSKQDRKSSACIPPRLHSNATMAGSPSGADAARTRWELENNITAVSEVDGYFRYNQAEQQAIQAQKPWARDPHYFKQ
jgi:hypothetical protein